MYENICLRCNPGAAKKGEQTETRTVIPTTYVVETSRSIYERSREHKEGATKGCDKNHMVRHQKLEHGRDPDPNFHIKVFTRLLLPARFLRQSTLGGGGEREQYLTPEENFLDAISHGSKLWRRSLRV